MNYRLISEKKHNTSIIDQILYNRGIPFGEGYHYLNTTDADVLDPLLLDNMENGAKMLISHIKQNHHIYVQVDEDCDGYTSAAFLLNYLNKLFPYYTQNYITYRTHNCKAHGLVMDDIPAATKLVIVPDAGSNEIEKHAELKNRGIDLLIIDHHNVEQTIQHACLINNQYCEYPNKSLSGVGIVYKFCSYVDSLLGIDNATYFLDLVAAGCVADMMPLNEFETKHLVFKGLSEINNPFLKGMLAKEDFYLKGKLTPHGVSFCIAPAVNSVTRVGTFEERMMLFEAMLEYKAYDKVPSTKRGCKGQEETKVEQACRNCTNIRNRQNKERDASLELIDDLIIDNNLLDNPLLIIQLDKTTAANPNITGLIANQVAAKYNRPTLVLNEYEEDGEIVWRGSGRNIKGTDFNDFQEFLLDSQLTEYSSGHDNAFGVAVKDSQLNELKEYANKHLNACYFQQVYAVDAIIDAQNLSGLDVLSIGDLKDLWGQGMEEPKVAIENLRINANNIELLAKGPTIKITPANREDGLSYILFKTSEDVYNTLYSEYGLTTINVVGTCARNTWSNTPQIIIEDFEIVRKQEFYF